MLKLLVIADDFTGAIDTGVQFTTAGAKTIVLTDMGRRLEDLSKEFNVVVLDTESRHINSNDAYKIVYAITQKAIKAGVPHIFKKTDSALRGNVGMELQALLDASGKTVLPFVPALPKMHRTTYKGYQYIDGVLLENSVFRQDPLEPMTKSYVPDIIAFGNKVNTKVVPIGEVDHLSEREPYIAVYDCETTEQAGKIAEDLKTQNELSIMAGCAGLAAALPSILGICTQRVAEIKKYECFFAVCGSVNPITVRQLEYASHHGFYRHYLTPEQKLNLHYWDSEEGKVIKDRLITECTGEKFCIIDSNDPADNETAEYAARMGCDNSAIRERISRCLGDIIKERLRRKPLAALMIMGGDTLMGFINVMDIIKIEPIAELLPGTVLSNYWTEKECYSVISKSGGFGDETLLIDLAKKVINL